MLGRSATVRAAAAVNRLEFCYDEALDVLTVEGVRYTGDFFRSLAKNMPLEHWFKIIERNDGTIRLGSYFVAPLEAELH